MTQIETARHELAALIRQRYAHSPYLDDMIQVAWIEYSRGASLYASIATARRAEKKWTKPRRVYGESTYSCLDYAGLRSCMAAEDGPNPRELAIRKERKAEARAKLTLLLRMPYREMSEMLGIAPKTAYHRKHQIREMLACGG